MRSRITISHLLSLAVLAAWFSKGEAAEHQRLVSLQNKLDVSEEENCYCELDSGKFMDNCKLSGCEDAALQVNPQSKTALLARGIRSKAFSEGADQTSLILKGLALETLESDAFDGLDSIETLDISENIIEEIQDSTVLRGLTSLKNIDLQGNRLRAVESGIFRRTTNLKKVNLNNNDISTLSQSTFVKPEGTIEEIYLANNELSEIEGSSFYFQSNLRILDLSNNRLTSLPEGFLQEAQQLSEVNLSHNMLDAQSLDPALLTVHSSKVDLSYNVIESLTSPGSSSSILRGLHATTALHLNHNRIANITKDLFNGATNLVTIDLGDNRIASIDSQSFSGLNELEEILLSGNRLERLDHAAPVFSQLPMIKLIDLSHNRLESVKSSAFDMSGFAAYEGTLDLGHNRLTAVTEDNFRIRGLRKLNLENNAISTVSEKNPFGNLYFTEVVLDNNDITEVKDGMFNSPFLTSVSLKNNWIESVQPGCFRRMCHALDDNCEVDLRGNRIGTLKAYTFEKIWPEVDLFMQGSEILEIEANAFENGPKQSDIVDLEDNNLASIGSNTFKGLKFIRELRLSQNSIMSVDSNAFDQFDGLLTLNMSDNLLGILDGSYLSPISSLNILDLSRNSIESIEPRSFNNPNLSSLNLVENRLLEVPAFSFEGLPALHELKLDHNTILRLETSAFSGMSSLEDLSLSQNRISRIGPSIFRGATGHLKNIDISHNRLERIYPSSFENMPNLMDLSLNNNKLDTLTAPALQVHGEAYPAINLSANGIENVNWLPDVKFSAIDLSDNDIEFLPGSVDHSGLILDGNPGLSIDCDTRLDPMGRQFREENDFCVVSSK